MRVLGISPLDKDTNVTFMEDGRVLFACGEERLSRVKLQDGFPDLALKLGFERTGWDPASIDHVAYAFFDGEGEARLIEESLARDVVTSGPGSTSKSVEALRRKLAEPYSVDRRERIPGFETVEDEHMPRKSWLKRTIYSLATRSAWLDHKVHRRFLNEWKRVAIEDHARWTQELEKGLARYGLQGKLKRFNHHDTHAANAFYASGFDEALLVTLDGYGSGNCGGIYLGSRDGLKPLHKFRFPNSLGHFYEHVTSGLGFKPNRHEGKIVGLAAYGDPGILEGILLDRFDTSNGDIIFKSSMNYFFTRDLAGHFAKRDVAAAYQRVLETVTRDVVGYWLKKTGMRKVAMSGGVNANVKLNQRVRELPGVESVFVYPNMGDGGCGTGAAMLVFGNSMYTRTPYHDVYLGPDYSDAQIRAALEKAELRHERSDSIEDRLAQLLTEDYIIGRFNGRMEYGPRALGNRSVLYQARDPEVNQWLNQQLGRTEFMPFAPSALASEANKLFKNVSGCEKTAEFMTLTFDCTEFMKRSCPAAVHVDGTARPQLVTPESNPSYHKLLTKYHERTGIPSFINTSFNMHEEPIVCSPDDAIRAFLLGNIDYLAIGSFLVPHPKLKENRTSRSRPASQLVRAGS